MTYIESTNELGHDDFKNEFANHMILSFLNLFP